MGRAREIMGSTTRKVQWHYKLGISKLDRPHINKEQTDNVTDTSFVHPFEHVYVEVTINN